jgi:predicted DNA binding CopG/RHH family protein
MSPKKQNLDALARILSGVDPARLAQVLDKKERINLRVSEADKEAMQSTAKAFGLTVTDYLLRLHAFAQETRAARSKR